MKTRAKQQPFLLRAAATLLLAVLLAALGTQTAWAAVTWDGGTGTDTNPYYVNMPTTGTKTLDLSDCGVTTFKIYDGRGLDGKSIRRGLYIHNGKRVVIK